MRAFLAVPPDTGWSESARALLARIRPALPDASWTRPESWHLTLRFLGEVSPGVVSRFASAIGDGLERLEAGALSTEGAVVFPPRGPARVLGVELAEDGGPGVVAEMARRAEAAARGLDLPPERRPFRPHVTFARLRRPWPGEAVARYRTQADGWTFPVWPVQSCVLYESRLAPEGAIHTPVASWALAASGQTA
ncbi:MAG: RNA 2',3'-cyclic phosphodiesterase [Acidobacteriota bacterium]